MRSVKGFTLIEMLVAITILAVIALMSWRGLDAIARSRGAVSDQITEQRGLQSAFGQLDADLRFAARVVDPGNALPGVQLGAGELIVLRQAPSVETGALRHQLVRYRVQDDALVRITRTVTSPQDIAQVLAAPEWEGATTQVLARGIASLALRVWTPQGWATPGDDNANALAGAQNLVAQAQANLQPATGVELTLRTDAGEQFVRALIVRD